MHDPLDHYGNSRRTVSITTAIRQPMKEPVDRRCGLNCDVSSLHGILSIDSEELDCLKSDCSEAFTCRSIPDSNENYSSGSTYFIRADEDPRCFLEKLALSIFKFHTKDATFNHKLSGAEWWTQVIDCRDDVGFHWDRDYGNMLIFVQTKSDLSCLSKSLSHFQIIFA